MNATQLETGHKLDKQDIRCPGARGMTGWLGELPNEKKMEAEINGSLVIVIGEKDFDQEVPYYSLSIGDSPQNVAESFNAMDAAQALYGED